MTMRVAMIAEFLKHACSLFQARKTVIYILKCYLLVMIEVILRYFIDYQVYSSV